MPWKGTNKSKAMSPIALFYHVYLGGGVIPVNPDNVFRIIQEQVEALTHSDLLAKAEQVFVGVAGPEGSAMAVSQLFSRPVTVSDVKGSGELPTMKVMHEYSKAHPDHLICYLHTKGAIHNGNPVYESWRRCMERVVVNRWKECAACLLRGYDTAGAHWLTPARSSFIGPVPYWGGNFFWAKASYLNLLPEIDVEADRYQAEVWIGKSPRKPNVWDFAKHFPMSGCAP